MKFTVTMKSPDAIDDALEDLSEDDKEVAWEFACKFMKWGEYVTIEFDTDKGTATVVK